MRKKILDFLHRTEISTLLAYLCSNFVAMATPLSFKNSHSVLKFTSPEIPTVHAKNFTISCRELMNAIFCPNLVAMATALTSMKFYIPYLNSPTSKTF